MRLTFGSSGMHNVNMVRFLRRLLVSACSLMVLMPMGWCCWLLPAAHAGAPEAATPCRSCCSQQQTKPTPAQQKDAPRPAPCECKPVVADLALPKHSDTP